jgi:two-component system CheB/CheR fusion protein
MLRAHRLATLPEARRAALTGSGPRDGSRVRPELRDRIVFSVHDLLLDPPFGSMHLVSCRNVLIYLWPAAQQQITDILAWSIVPGGLLWLGASEDLPPGASTHFERLGAHRIYRRRKT